MKRILAVLLTVLTLLSATTFGAFTAEAKGTAYTIKKLDKSEKYYGGRFDNYYYYPVFKGNSKGIKKINTSLKKKALNSVNAFNSEPGYPEDVINTMYESGYYDSKLTFYNTEKCKVTYNKGKIISVKHQIYSKMEGRDCSDFWGSTYNKKSGKELKIYDVVPNKYSPKTKSGYKKLKRLINKKLKKKYGSSVAETFRYQYNNKNRLCQANFYINGKGKVVVCFGKYEIASGASGCLSVAVPSRYAK